MTTRHTRREFMGLTGAGIAGVAGMSWLARNAAAQVGSPLEPDLVIFNAKVYTVDPITPQAQAFAVKGDRFVAVGSNDALKPLIGTRTRSVDARQMTMKKRRGGR